MRFEKLPSKSDTLVKWTPDDLLELDELWYFVLKRSQKRWVDSFSFCEQFASISCGEYGYNGENGQLPAIFVYLVDTMDKIIWCGYNLNRLLIRR